MKKVPMLDSEILKQLNIPVLSQDEKWLVIMETHMDDEFQTLVTRQSTLMVEERQGGHQLIQLKRQKREALSQLLGLTAQLQRNSEEAESQAERIKTVLERINEEIDDLQFRLEAIPSEVQKLNIELLEETIVLGYDELLADHKKIAVLNLKIEKLRNELLAKNEEKFELEDNASAMGQLLHSLLGKELSDDLDAQYRLSDKEYIL